MPAQRADARRNYGLLLAVAKEEIAAHGPDASLEQIARVAGVGSATLRRHFPSRHALLEAVFRERVETLCARARELTGGSDTRAALLEWLSAVVADAATIRGLATALTLDPAIDAGAAHEYCCSAQLTEAGEPLVRRAADDGALAPGVTIADLLTLITGIALATEHRPDAAAEADRLLGLAVAGVSPSRR
ncbi:TetR/AcrR family transcriptional regulator [Microbispora triticiradicis]|uniref:TetR/AcrR family transcriptional regulator n=3 Tax=Microbispora TaxID=2005 RepID=A0ABY3LZZ1_9ACTN|nr:MULTISPECIES: TetR/AcrR family transcriptional regulator [Microbispora]RGA02666.1 TetR/AcrR family transcriptional regulator [Microbispora triticiradicis]TLP52356.1 TetR/AcrR family transcriptional regulator [Microbispora fusca]TYB60454.1 TetR/AcrR family transcriptional regulator [Microbispora tritici]GLW20595.1 TetR family transcriptional regulator [Microbispora amethystogenes]